MEREQKCCGSQFKFSQLFGYKSVSEKIQEEDIISVMKFDSSGKFLAIGDHAGRIIVFETPQITTSKKKCDNYQYCTEFQAQVREFDSLRSQDVDEEVTAISWMRNQGRYLKMITTNTKDIKLWKIFQKVQRKIARSAGKELNMPKIQDVGNSYTAVLQKTFPSQHSTPINAVSQSQNEEYILSTDDIQAYLWSLEKPDCPFMPVDLKGNTKFAEDVKETITCSKFHPTSDSLFVYGTNKGTLKMGDLRTRAICDDGVTFKYDLGSANKNFFTEMISSYSSASFLNNGRHIVTRDYLTVKIWDVANAKKPVASIVVQDSLKSKLCEIFENDAILDRFGVSLSADSQTIMTGNYNNCFHLIDVADSTNSQYELSYKKQTVMRNVVPNKMTTLSKVDYLKKTVAGDFHPKKNVLAVASLNCFFFYSM